MHDLAQLQKEQIGLNLEKYLVDGINEYSKMYALNRHDIIIEAIQSYLKAQREKEFYKNFETLCNEAKDIINSKISKTSLQHFVDETKHNTNT